MKPYIFGWLLTAVGVCGFISPGLAMTWHVEQNGTGDFLEIQDAVNASAAGDTILIGPGDYNQAREIQIPLWSAPTDAFVNLTVEDLTLIGVGPDEVVIGPSQYYSAYYGPLGICAAVVSQPWRVEGVTLRNLDTGIYTYSHVKVNNCRIEENLSTGIALLNSDGAHIENSEFINHMSWGIINYNPSSGVQIINCNFDYSLIHLRSAVDAIVERCNFTGGVGDGGSVGIQFDNSTGSVATCIFSGYTNFGLTGISGSNVEVDSCTIHAGESGAGIIALGYSIISVSSSIVEGGFAGVMIEGGGSMTVSNSHVLSDTGYLVKCENRGGTNPTHMDFTGNYWGTNSLDDIAAGIWDKNDNSYVTTIIDYSPIATGPVSVEQKTFGDVKSMFR